MALKNPFKKAVKKAASTASEEFVLTAASKTKEAINDVKTEVVEAANDFMPYLIVGGILLMGLALVRRQPPITVKVVVKQL